MQYMSSPLVYSLFIVNKSGGLIYQKDYSEIIEKLSTNDYLILAGTFHGVHAIASRLSPTQKKSSGIELLQGDQFNLHCFQTLTGLKFLLITNPSITDINAFQRKAYEVYADYAMKNPFYQPEMPIVRADLFDQAMLKIVKQFNQSGTI